MGVFLALCVLVVISSSDALKTDADLNALLAKRGIYLDSDPVPFEPKLRTMTKRSTQFSSATSSLQSAASEGPSFTSTRLSSSYGYCLDFWVGNGSKVTTF
jgi:hypothetical protein